MEQNNGYAKGILIGTLAGGIIGSVTALFYAAKSGKELRSDIKNKGEELFDSTEKYIADAKVKAADKINDGKKVLIDAKNQIDSIVLTGKEVVDDEIKHIKSSFRAGVNAYNETKIGNENHA